MTAAQAWASVVKIGLTLPETSIGTSYGTPALKVKGKLIVRLKEDGVTVVLRMDMFERELRMKSNPETFYITDHYRDYPAVLVRLATLNAATLRELLEQAWRFVAPKSVAKLLPIRG